MTEASARVILDSMSSTSGRTERLTTIEGVIWRPLLAELNTHRAFSRNSASSRAIPATKSLKRVVEDPAFPVAWLSEKTGMSGGEPLAGQALTDAQDLWWDIHQFITGRVGAYIEAHPEKEDRLHKSALNRPLELFGWHRVVITSTHRGWHNFFDLRCDPQAQVEMQEFAWAVRNAYNASPGKILNAGEWHLPYIDDEERDNLHISDLLRISTARCTRVSSDHAGEKFDYLKDFRLFHDLVSSSPMHASPLEHVALPGPRQYLTEGNFDGFEQLRHNPDLIKSIDTWVEPS